MTRSTASSVCIALSIVAMLLVWGPLIVIGYRVWRAMP